jgi:cellulose biosynthesis protein BcsQ
VPIIAVASAKGGVGKTTSALAIAAALATDPTAPPVLLWDLDPSGDATLRLGFAIEPQGRLGMLLAGRADPSDALGSYGIEDATRRTVEQFDVVPASVDITDTETHAASALGGELVGFRLRQLCAGRSVVIDTSPGLRTLLSRSAIAVADALLIHIVPEPHAERHIIDVVSALRGMGGKAEVHIVATMVGSDPVALTRLRDALAFEGLKISAAIPREAVVNDAVWSGATALGAAPGSRAAEAYRLLARRLSSLVER